MLLLLSFLFRMLYSILVCSTYTTHSTHSIECKHQNIHFDSMYFFIFYLNRSRFASNAVESIYIYISCMNTQCHQIIFVSKLIPLSICIYFLRVFSFLLPFRFANRVDLLRGMTVCGSYLAHFTSERRTNIKKKHPNHSTCLAHAVQQTTAMVLHRDVRATKSHGMRYMVYFAMY